MLKPIIEVCTSNIRHGTYALMKKLEDEATADVIEYGCLGNCGQCYAEAYAYVDGEIISGESRDIFEQKLYHKLDEIRIRDEEENELF